MSIDYKNDVQPLVNQGIDLVEGAFSGVTGPWGVVIKVVGAALKIASDAIGAGLDPLTTIQRMHAADPLLKETENSWAKELDAKFGAAKK